MKRVTATDAKNNFGGLLDDVAALGSVEIVKHGRVVAVMYSARTSPPAKVEGDPVGAESVWGADHLIPPALARTARMISEPSGFDED